MKFKGIGLLVLMMFLSTHISVIQAETTHLSITTETSEYFSARAFSTTIKVENADNIAGLQFKLTYDSAKYQINSVNKNHFNVVYNAGTPGELLITLATASSPVNGNQDLVTLSVTVLNDSEPGVLTDFLVLDNTYDHEYIHQDVNNDLVYVSADMNLGHSRRRLLGDVNLDDKISIMDVTMLQLYLAESLVLEGLALEASDLSGNNDLSLLDIVHVQEYITGLESNVVPSP